MKKQNYFIQLIALLLISKIGYAQYGAIDMTFGRPALQVGDSNRFDLGGGTTITVVNDIVVQPDQKIIVGGTFTTYSNVTNKNRIIRLNQDGNIDASFQPATGFNNGVVQSLALQSNGKIIAGGTFTTYNSQPRSGIVRINDIDGSLDATFTVGAGFNSASNVYAICIQPDGKIILGGSFTTYDGNTASKIVRLDTTGAVDASFSTGTGFNNDVRSICYDALSNKIYVAGNFTSYNGTSNIQRIVRLDLNGNIDGGFVAGTGFNNTVYKILLDGSNNIIAAGNFTTYQGQNQKRLCRLLSSGNIDASFSSGNGFNMTVLDINLDINGNIICGGNFSVYDTDTIGKLCRITPNGNIDNTFYSSAYSAYSFTGGDIATLAVQTNGSIVFGGGFLEYNNTLRGKIARVQSDGWLDNTFWTTWGVTRGGTYSDVIVSDMKILPDNKILVLLRGLTARYNGFGAAGIIRLFPDGEIDTSFHSGTGFTVNSTLNSYVKCLTVDTIRQKIYVGGVSFGFTHYNGIPRKNIACLNWDGTLDQTFNIGNGFSGNVNNILLQPDGKIIVGGDFTSYDGSTYNRIIRLDTLGIPDLTFISPSATNGFNSTVNSLAWIPNSNGDILVGGSFNTYNTISCNTIVRLHGNGIIDNTFNAATTNAVTSIKIQSDGKIVAGGSTLKGISRLETNGTLDATFDSNIGAGTGLIKEVELQNDEKIIAIGYFTLFNNISNRGLIRLNNDGTIDNTFNTGYGLSNSWLGSIPGGETIEIQKNDNKLLIGGNFSSYDSVFINCLARIDAGPLTSINEISHNSSFSVYPNPSTGKVTINLSKLFKDELTGTLTNVIGEKVEFFKIENELSELQLNHPPGIYFLTLQNSKQILTQKIVLQ